MDKQLFWKLIAEANAEGKGNDEAACDALTDKLCELSGPDILTFDRIWREEVDDAFVWDLWIAAALLLDGADGNDFNAFRNWLVGRGEQRYKSAVQDPDSLADLAGTFGNVNLMLMFDAAADAYVETVGHDIPEPTLPPPMEPLGEAWDGSEEMAQQRLPKLYAATRGG